MLKIEKMLTDNLITIETINETDELKGSLNFTHQYFFYAETEIKYVHGVIDIDVNKNIIKISDTLYKVSKPEESAIVFYIFNIVSLFTKFLLKNFEIKYEVKIKTISRLV